MISLVLLLPFILCFILFLFKKEKLNKFMINLYALVHIICSTLLFFNINPYDINQNFFQIDNLNRIFLIVLSIVYLMVAIYNNGYIDDKNINSKRLRHYAYGILLFIFSMTGAILSTNLGIMWVFIELTTLTSAYLIYFYKTKHSIEAAWKYVFICSIGIALAFVGIILLTFSTVNLNSLFFNDLYTNAQNFNSFWLKLSFIFILFGIGTKMGLSPVHFWLPDAHAQAPSPISALLSATLLNSAFLMIIKVFKILIISNNDSYARILLFIMGFLSLFVAAVFIYHIGNYKRMLAYSSIENMGILIIGLALGKLGMVASIIHLIGHSFIKGAFFLNAGNVLKIYDTKKIKSIKGLLTVDDKTGKLLILSLLALCAFPPSILFISEFLIVKAMLECKYYAMSVVFLILLTIILYGLSKAIFKMSFGENNEIKVKKLPITMYLPQFILLIVAFILGIYLPFVDIIKLSVLGF